MFLFNILYLLPDLFDLGLKGNGLVRDGQVRGLGQDGIGLPVHLLGNEIQLAANALSA